MIYLRLHDRLGNLMFMIATALHLDKDVCVFCNNDRDFNYVKRMVELLNLPVRIEIPKSRIENRFEYYTPTVFKKIPYIKGAEFLLDGYFQSYKYFDYEEVIHWFRCPEDLDFKIENKWGGVLKSCETVSLHIRRGDYLQFPERFPFVGKCYIKNAISKFNSTDISVIVTSDDINWCKKHIKGNNIYYSEGENEYFDLFLASKCKHNILSNSTFSWWGAYLNRNPDKRVIVPGRWYGPLLSKESDEKNGELIPVEWETVPCRWDNMQSWATAYYRYWRCNWRDLFTGLKAT